MIVHVRSKGLKVVIFDETEGKHMINKVDLPEYRVGDQNYSGVDYIKTTPNGKFVILGLNKELIKFMRIDREKKTLVEIDNGNIEVSS